MKNGKDDNKKLPSEIKEDIGEVKSSQLNSDKIIHSSELTENLETKKNSDISAQKESIEEIPKLEKENFKINSLGWKEVTDPTGVKMLENSEGDVWEYIEGIKVGEQLFTGPDYDEDTGELISEGSAIRETKKAGKKLPASSKVFLDIFKKDYGADYDKFLQGEDINFCGRYNPDNELFCYVDKVFAYWCEDGSHFSGSIFSWDFTKRDGGYGFSARCLKE